MDPTNQPRFFFGVAMSPANQLHFFVGAIMGLAISGAVSWAINKAVSTEADVADGFSKLFLW